MKKEKRQIAFLGRILLIGYALYLCAALKACILDIPINVYGFVILEWSLHALFLHGFPDVRVPCSDGVCHERQVSSLALQEKKVRLNPELPHISRKVYATT